MTSLALGVRSERISAFAGAGAYALAVFCAAALVFTVEPLVGKLTLPVLGGSPAVWNTSLAFFQLGLLGGYAYAHLLQKLTSIRRQALVHLAILALAGHSRRVLYYPWALLAGGSLVSIAANSLHAILAAAGVVPAVVSALVAAVPPVVLLAVTHLSVVLVQHVGEKVRTPKRETRATAAEPVPLHLADTQSGAA